MIQQNASNISRFFIAGINYKKTEASTRGHFSIGEKQYEAILSSATAKGVSEMFILSTCNRTEIYGMCDNVGQLIELLCSQTPETIDTFTSMCYIKQGTDAINHLFEVGAGLESQILGDYEIIGQVKTAVKFSKERGFIGGFLERLVNNVIESTKAIKNQTTLSTGTVSVSFAAIQYLKKRFESIKNKKVLLLGVGKIGSNTCKNLRDYLDCTEITLINRTEEKAKELANVLGLKHAPYDQLKVELQKANIILVATGSDKPILLKSDVEGFGNKLIIDMSVPYNVEKGVQDLHEIDLVNVDELSRIQDETYKKRLAEVPKARAIIAARLATFLDWVEMRRKIGLIKAAQSVAVQIRANNTTTTIPADATNNASSESDKLSIEKAVKELVIKMRTAKQSGCIYIDAMNSFLKAS